MLKNTLIIVISAALSCIATSHCLALQKTWEDVLQDATMDETAIRTNETETRVSIERNADEQCAVPKIYSESAPPVSDDDIAKILIRFSNEPTIREIQQAAIQYAEVNKEKIDAWRKAAQAKAVLPSLSVDVGKYLTDYYHWDSGTNPDTLVRGKAPTDWEVTVSWDLGDLIWSTDQTSIDVRSRLMVQLRDDILNEVTRLYFERRRLQIELLTNPPKNIQVKLEKELRLQELTAGIDALTGGWFSRKLSTSVEHPSVFAKASADR